ncbi:hypothetical protein CGZ98_06100 [Enemella evansiae]|uniref:HD domain-containing protein n=1 Tax=Enemella evansiae TaxID=2016499 RepID=UPI000B960368|nr:HD domain-containing protein [Enemella evansiae]OYO13114.1 hypothetical protein CGZ98_06100 [Enemella evansiae]
MTDYITAARQAYAATQEAAQQREEARERERAATLQAAQVELVRDHGEQASADLARVLGADPADPEFRGLQWSAEGIRVSHEHPNQYRWNQELQTNFQGVPVCADFHTFTNDSVLFKVVTGVERGVNADQTHGERFATLAQFGKAVARLEPAPEPGVSSTSPRSEREAALAAGVARGWATPAGELSLADLAPRLRTLTGNHAEDPTTISAAAQTMTEARRAFTDLEGRFDAMVAGPAAAPGIANQLTTGHTAQSTEQQEEIPLKAMDSALLTVEVLGRTSPDARPRVEAALGAAAMLHRTQTRANRGDLPRTPYIEHPLRNAARIQRWGVDDPSILTAALLHDVVEDGAAEAAHTVAAAYPGHTDQEKTLAWITDAFGPETSRIVRAVTNPPKTPSEPAAERARSYQQHVAASIAGDPAVLLVKAADFADNAGSLHHNLSSVEDPSFFAKRVAKYQPLTPVFQAAVDDALARGRLAPQVGAAMTAMLEGVSIHLEEVNAAAQRIPAPTHAMAPVARSAMTTSDRLPAPGSRPGVVDRSGPVAQPSYRRHPLGRSNI